MRARWSTNLILKLVSLLVAVFIWNVYRTEPTRIRVMEVPLDYGPPPQHLELVGDPPDKVQLRVEATEVALRNLEVDALAGRIDLSDLTTGQQFVPVTTRSFQVPSDVQILRIDPDQISLHVERKRERPVPIEAVTRGEPAAGHELVEIRFDPAVITIQGAESEVARISSVKSTPIDLAGRRTTFREQVQVVAENSVVQPLQQRTALATVTIREIPEARGFIHIPVAVENAAGRAELDPPDLGVLVEGPPSKLAGMTAGSFRIIVDATGLEPRDEPYELTPIITLVPPLLADHVLVTGTSHDTLTLHLLP